MKTVVSRITDLEQLLSQLNEERLRSINLTSSSPDTGVLDIFTTKRHESILVNLVAMVQLAPLVAVAQRDCIGQKVVTLAISEASQTFEMVLENGFSIRTL